MKVPRPHVFRLTRWWIAGTLVSQPGGGDDYEPVGPYDTRAEAEDDLRGLRRFWRTIELDENGRSKR